MCGQTDRWINIDMQIDRNIETFVCQDKNASTSKLNIGNSNENKKKASAKFAAVVTVRKVDTWSLSEP